VPIEYEIIEDKKLELAKGSGVVTGTDVIRHLNSLASEERYKAPMKKVIDYRSIDSMDISAEEALAIALKKDTFSNKFRGERCAFVTTKDKNYDGTQVYQSIVDTSVIANAVFSRLRKR
jgi:hypothetical protein